MTAELTFYLLLTFIGLLLCLRTIKNNHIYNVLTVILFVIYSFITRFSGYDLDINVYANSLSYSSLNTYFLREPVFWITSRYVYKILKSTELTFMFYDFISFIVILKVRSNLKFPQYFPYLLLLFFPFIMGLNNVYRQYLSYCFILYFLSLQFTNSNQFKKWFYLIVSIFTHNASAVFTPLAFIINDEKRLSYKALISSLGVIILLPFVLDSKSNMDTGEVAAGLYIVFLLIIFIFYLASYKFKLSNTNKKFTYMFIYMSLLLTISTLLMGSGQSKRIGMYCLVISLIPLVSTIETKYKHKPLVRVITFIILILPTLVFSSSLQMLLTSLQLMP